jgi:hypothetical protein
VLKVEEIQISHEAFDQDMGIILGTICNSLLQALGAHKL